MAKQQIKPHELSNVTFYPPGNGKVEKWKNVYDLNFSPGAIMFKMEDGRTMVVCAECYTIEQVEKTPESNIIMTPASTLGTLDNFGK